MLFFSSKREHIFAFSSSVMKTNLQILITFVISSFHVSCNCRIIFLFENFLSFLLFFSFNFHSSLVDINFPLLKLYIPLSDFQNLYRLFQK